MTSVTILQNRNKIPLISIVVLTYNSGKYIKRCLQSLFRQSITDFEVLIVDAGSTDNTHAVVSKFDARFKWLELPMSDMGSARNYGMRTSRGQFLCFLDSDDFYLPTKLERQIRMLQTQPYVDVVFCSAWHFRTGKLTHLGLKKLSSQPNTLKDFLEGKNHNLSTMCIRRSVWEAGFAFGEGERGRYGEEWRLQLSMALKGVKMKFYPDPQTVVEIRPDSHTSWSIQWIIKQQAINELQHVATLLTTVQRNLINISKILDEFRFKLVVALLLDGRKQEAHQAALSIYDPLKARKANRLLTLCRYLPKATVRQFLQTLWILKQNSSFEWHPMPPSLKSEFAAVYASEA